MGVEDVRNDVQPDGNPLLTRPCGDCSHDTAVRGPPVRHKSAEVAVYILQEIRGPAASFPRAAKFGYRGEPDPKSSPTHGIPPLRQVCQLKSVAARGIESDAEATRVKRGTGG